MSNNVSVDVRTPGGVLRLLTNVRVTVVDGLSHTTGTLTRTLGPGEYQIVLMDGIEVVHCKYFKDSDVAGFETDDHHPIIVLLPKEVNHARS